MTHPSSPATHRWQMQRAGPAAGAARRPPHGPPSAGFGDRANAWLRAAAEAWRPLVHRGADAAFVAAVRAAEARADAAWNGVGIATGATAAPDVGSTTEGAGASPQTAGRIGETTAADRSPDAVRCAADRVPAASLLALRTDLRRDGVCGAAAVQALGTACAAARPTLGSRPFDSQIIGARALLDGRLAEMATGEGKTLTVALAAAVAALAGVPVHLVTANDYLVARDAAALRPLYAALGLTVGAVLQGDAPARRAAAYACDIACVTARELVFDHLRDALLPAAGRCQRGLHLAIVDEADAILIDEARVPLVLSQPVDVAAAAAALADAQQALGAARALRPGRHFRLDANGPSARLTPAGQAALALAARQPAGADGAAGRDAPTGGEKGGASDRGAAGGGAPDCVPPNGVPPARGASQRGAPADGAAAAGHSQDDGRSAADSHPPGAGDSPAAGRPAGDLWRHPAHREHAVCTALAALHGLQRERHYVVRDGKVLIVDETTGRVAPGRAWSAGLHTLVELKEGCEPQAPLVTVAQSTYPRFFARYPRLAGLSGTLHDARGELLRAYGLAVRRVPLRLPCRRRVLPHRLFADHAALWRAVAGRVAALHAAGRPVLVATDSVADATALSAVLHAHGLPHACLHAGQPSEPGVSTDDGSGGHG